jgi:hypothetical protein
MKSNIVTIKMMDIYVADDKFKQSVIDEIEGQIITQDADYMKDKNTLLEQVLRDSVSKSDTVRGGTEFNLFNASTIILPDCDSKVMESIMFGAQTAKQFQDIGQKYQDSMKHNLYSGDKHKNQESVKFQIEEYKVIVAYVTNWQEHTKNASFQQGQERNEQDRNFSKRSTTF